MSDAQCLSRLTRTLVCLELALAQLDGVEGMDSVQEQISDLCADVEMHLDELTSIG
jgi:hypothetical protein